MDPPSARSKLSRSSELRASPSEFIKEQIEKPAGESKKWIMAMYGLKGVAGFFFVAIIFSIFMPSVMDKVVTLTQIAITAWGGIVGIYLGAQGSVEFKATSALQNLNRNTEENIREEYKEERKIEITDRRDPKDFDDGYSDY